MDHSIGWIVADLGSRLTLHYKVLLDIPEPAQRRQVKRHCFKGCIDYQDMSLSINPLHGLCFHVNKVFMVDDKNMGLSGIVQVEFG
jgi:hypothetical protein